MRALVIGASGMLGNAVLRLFANSEGFDVRGSARSTALLKRLPADLQERIVCGIDVNDPDSLARHLASGSLDELTLTTNGTQLARFAAELVDAGVRRINVSLDALKPDLFLELNDVADRRVFGFAKSFARKLGRSELLARRKEHRRTQKASDMVGAKRGRRAESHRAHHTKNPDCGFGRTTP